MSSRLVTKLWVSEREEEAIEKEQGEVTKRVTRRVLPTMYSRLLTKLWVGGRERRAN
jgi:hypothetical protein